MKFKTGDAIDKWKEVTWSDHYPACEKCRNVDLEVTATFVNACAYPGAALLNEELAKRQAPIVAQKRKEVREWAKKTGVFKGA